MILKEHPGKPPGSEYSLIKFFGKPQHLCRKDNQSLRFLNNDSMGHYIRLSTLTFEMLANFLKNDT